MEASLERASERYAILETYAKLAKDRPLTEIKASDVCAAHGISKSSFYRLFRGVDDILIWYQNFTSDIGMHRVGISYSFKQGHLTSILLMEQFHDLYKEYAHSPFWNTDFSLQCINNHVEAMRHMLKLHDVEMSTELLYELRGIAMLSHELVAYYINDDTWNGDKRPTAERLVEIMHSFIPEELKPYFDMPTEPAETPAFVGLLVQSMLTKSMRER